MYGAVAAREYRDRNKRTNHVVTAILARDLRGKEKNVAVDYVLRPSTGVHVDRLSTDGALLRAAAEEAQSAVINYFKA